MPSRASIGGHPIHPMLIPFPIAFRRHLDSVEAQ
jgi:uncharacterized membrane protein